MSERELAKILLERVPEYKLRYVIAYLEGVMIPEGWETPNAETLAALREVEALKRNPNRKPYENFSEVLEDSHK